MILTASECTQYSNITASAATITASGLIPVVQDRLTMMANNYFVTDLTITDCMAFDNSAKTIIASGNSFLERGFADGDEIFIYNSHRNDGYYSVASVSTSVLTLTSAMTIYSELSSQTIYIAVVKWPVAIKYIAAQMVAYDYDVRPSVAQNITSRSLGPLSESYTNSTDAFGYPKSIMESLSPYRMGRLL